MVRDINSPLPIPYNRLLEETRLKLAIARQHLDALGEFGLNETWLQALEVLANQAESIPSYSEQLGEQKLLTAAKNESLEACVQWGRKLKLRMELAFSEDKTKGLPFPLKDFRDSERNESRMITLMPSLIKLARRHATPLETAGQTEADLTRGEELYTQLKQANEAQEEYKHTRVTVTAERREVFHQLYAGVQRINQVGQAVYGVDTPNGRLFRSNWTMGRSGSEEDEGELEAVTPET